MRVSEDAGRYLCDFTYYTSLLQYWRDRGGERPVVFLHVPGGTEEGDLVRGRRVVVALIRALAEGVEQREEEGAWKGGRGGVK